MAKKTKKNFKSSSCFQNVFIKNVVFHFPFLLYHYSIFTLNLHNILSSKIVLPIVYQVVQGLLGLINYFEQLNK